ncbi:MAG: 3-phosphoshikimate 1-carboxyvinyltransferase [Actinomycetota bacterium]
MKLLRITPVDPPNAIVRVPGSRSITNRALICAALAHGESRLTGWLDAEDTRAMRNGLQTLGISINPNEDLHVHGTGGELEPIGDRIDCGASGTTIRFLTAISTLANSSVSLDGTPRLRERPIGALVEALGQLGASATDRAGFPPVHVAPSQLTGSKARLDASQSGQFVSALLMLAPMLRHEVTIEYANLVSEPFVEMTLEVMKSFGVSIEQSGSKFRSRGAERYVATSYHVEPDAMSASYFFGAAAVTGGSVTVQGLWRSSIQGDIAFIDLLEKMGCGVVEEPAGITVGGASTLRGIEADLNAMPDMAPTLAVVACFASGPTTLNGIAHLRLKESDRMQALQNELTKLGAEVTVTDSSMRIEPPKMISPATIETYDDHRIAMSFSIAGLRSEGIIISDPGCVAKTYPGFFEDLGKLGSRRPS